MSLRQARFAALGDKQLGLPQKSPYTGYGVIEWEFLRSKQTGWELAEALQGNIDHLQSEISGREQRIRALLGEGTGLVCGVGDMAGSSSAVPFLQ